MHCYFSLLTVIVVERLPPLPSAALLLQLHRPWSAGRHRLESGVGGGDHKVHHRVPGPVLREKPEHAHRVSALQVQQQLQAQADGVELRILNLKVFLFCVKLIKVYLVLA